MSDNFSYDKSVEMVALNQYMEQQQEQINVLQQEILLLKTKNTMLEKELSEVKSINSVYKDQIKNLTAVKERQSLSRSLSINRGVRNGISNQD
jgi:predicted RNase H-like nuclease (RuvC/YqgF family)